MIAIRITAIQISKIVKKIDAYFIRAYALLPSRPNQVCPCKELLALRAFFICDTPEQYCSYSSVRFSLRKCTEHSSAKVLSICLLYHNLQQSSNKIRFAFGSKSNSKNRS